MNAITQASKPTRLDQFRMEILPPESKPDFFAGMPAHVKPERFMRNLDNAIMQNPGLMDLDPRLIFREIAKAAALGLYLDPQLGEAYLIEAWNGKAKRKEPQLRVGYKGLIKLGRQSGAFTIMYAHEVHENDYFDCDQGADKKLVHKPKLFSDDRGPIIGYYAVVKYHDGEFDFEPLSIKQAHDVRDRSDGWKAYKAEKIKSTPWATDEVEMSKKTAIRKLCKRVPQSPELAEAIRIEDAAEHSEMRAVNITPPRPPKPPSPPQGQISAPKPPVNTPEAHDPETGEIDDRQIVRETGEDIGAVTEAEPGDPADLIGRLDEALACASDAATVEEIWSDMDIEAALEGDDINRAIADKLKARRLKQIGGDDNG